MLCLSRHEGESIYIGSDIEIKVLRSSSGQVRLGIVAPREVTILRAELEPHEKPKPPQSPPIRRRAA